MPEEGDCFETLEILDARCHGWGAKASSNGFFGGGGGMVLVPLLMSRCGLDRRRAFANSVAIIFPLCALSAVIYTYGAIWTYFRPFPI